jgi:hypothetical protein
MRVIRFAFPLAVASALMLPAPAFGQSEAENRATARALGQQGQAAFDAKEYKKSEEAFRRADGLFHAPTLSLGLARSQAAEGKFVEAWENYNRVILEGVTSSPAFARALGDAKAEIGAVEGRRSRITIALSGSDSAHVSLDERPLKSEALGIALFVDPGSHTVLATAEGFNPETRTIVVAEGKSETVSIALQPAPVAPRAATASPPAVLLSAPPPPGELAVASSGAGEAETTGAPNRVPSFIAFGVGGAGLIAGVIAGIVAVGQHGDLKTACASNGSCDPAEQSSVDSYHTVALVSTVGFVVAGAGAAAGVALWFLLPKGGARASNTAWIAPYVTSASVGAVGQF